MDTLKINVGAYALASFSPDHRLINQIGLSTPVLDNQRNIILNNTPAMLKRRLDFLGRAVLNIYQTCCRYSPAGPFITSSRHGNIGLTYELLDNMISENELSPTSFGLSVHNAIAGVISIIDKNENDIISISPGENGVLPALLEAACLFNRHADLNVVTVLFYDDCLPEFYARSTDIKPENLLVAGLCLFREASQNATKLQLDRLDIPASKDSSEQNTQVKLLFNVIHSQQIAQLSAFNSSWSCTQT